MKRLSIWLCALSWCLTLFGQPPRIVDTRIGDVSLRMSPSWYDDTTGELTVHLAAANQPEVDTVRWFLLADELAAPLGPATQPARLTWTPPYLKLTVPISANEIKARQVRLLEIQFVHAEAPVNLLAVVFPAAERDRLVKALADSRLIVERGLTPVDNLLNCYGLVYQSFRPNRGQSLEGPGVYLFSSKTGITAGNSCSIFKFAAKNAGTPKLEVNGRQAVYHYFEDLQFVGNAALEMQILETLCQISQPANSASTRPPPRHEESLF